LVEYIDGVKKMEDDKREELAKERNIDTHLKINKNYCGVLMEMNEGYAKVLLSTIEEMGVDELGMIHSGFIFGAANYCAVMAINHPNVVLTWSDCRFLVPIDIGKEVIFEAEALHTSTKKREVKVVGKTDDIKIFEGIFVCVTMEKHPLKMKAIVRKDKR
jgi:acyl-coenzyme A thioesterase PaaI-like protein